MATNDVRFGVIAAGFSNDFETARDHLDHNDSLVRASALRALHRMNQLVSSNLVSALSDIDSEVRRTAVECAVKFPDVGVHLFLDDEDVFVAEMAAWCLGERQVSDDEINALIHATTNHQESVVREACAAALGSIGDQRGLQAILIACSDKPAVRRRAILALAPFDGDEVDQALQTALTDRDWQVRQNAEILISPRGENHQE